MLTEPRNLTAAARMTLLDSDFQAGSPLPPGTTLRVAAELATYGLIDTEATLTRDGAIMRARIIDGALETFNEAT
jgi:hypothetical protein